ncbi:uncharacterized protein LOC134845679 [Symsagittifera roscoffensis]|uniref:uncharacterized protein LOC134845679 n=1 Tax=Symsagittifera roscoffensis TaxID=84072 RepID=UPI00307CBB16
MTSNLTFEESLQVLEKCLKLTFSLPYSSTSSSHHHSHHSASHTMSQQPPSLDLTSSRDFASSVASDFNSALLQLEVYFLRCRMLASIEARGSDEAEMEAIKAEIAKKDILIESMERNLKNLVHEFGS